jgi:uncharacterized phage protein gp47/JayE
VTTTPNPVSYGLTLAGLQIKPLTVIRVDFQKLLQTAFGDSFDVGDESNAGHVYGIVAAALSSLWELLQAIASSQDPDAATGAALEALSALTGTFRTPATFSTAVLTLTGTGTTPIPQGTVVATTSTAQQFSTDDDATLGALAAWVGTTVYLKDVRVTNNARCYQCTVAGTSGTTGPQTSDETIVDGTATWTYLGEGSSAVDVTSAATISGPIVAIARDITTKVGSSTGWSSVINLLDAVTGRAAATDSELRTLREQELSGDGKSTQDAIRADLLPPKVVGVTAVTVFVNNDDTTNVDGMPPHSVEALVRGGADQDILDALFAAVAGGIQTIGTTTGTVVDSQGTPQTVKFSRPVEILIYVDIHVTYDAELWPSNGADLIKAAIVAFGALQSTGKDAVSFSIGAQALKVDGVFDVPVCNIGTAPSPSTSTTISISTRQLAVFDTGRISVTATPGTP